MKEYIKNMVKKVNDIYGKKLNVFLGLMACGMAGAMGASCYKLGYDDSKFVDRTVVINLILDQNK